MRKMPLEEANLGLYRCSWGRLGGIAAASRPGSRQEMDLLNLHIRKRCDGHDGPQLVSVRSLRPN